MKVLVHEEHNPEHLERPKMIVRTKIDAALAMKKVAFNTTGKIYKNNKEAIADYISIMDAKIEETKPSNYTRAPNENDRIWRT